MIPYEQLAAALEKRAAVPTPAAAETAQGLEPAPLEDNTLSGANAESEYTDADVLSDEEAS